MSRSIRVALTLLVTGLCAAYLIWKIDLGRTLHVIGDANPWYLLAALALMLVTILPMACAGSSCSGRRASKTTFPG